MNAFVPTRHDPNGAPRKYSGQPRFFRAGRKSYEPSPLLKQTLRESNGAASSRSGMLVSAATCQMRAPSRWNLTLTERAYSPIRTTSSWGKMVPLRVFSSAITSVGALK